MKAAKIFRKIPKGTLLDFVASLNTGKNDRNKRLFIVGSCLSRLLNKQNINHKVLLTSLPKTYDKSFLNKDLHDLIEELLDFLAHRELNDDDLLKYRLKMDTINRYNLHEICSYTYKKVQKSISAEHLLSSEIAHNKYCLNKLRFDSNNSLVGILSEPDVSDVEMIGKLHEDLTNYYKAETLHLAHFQYMILRRRNITEEHHVLKLESIIDDSNYSSELLELYHIIFLIQKNNNTDKSKIIRSIELFERLEKRISVSEFNILYIGLTNFFAWQRNSGIRIFDDLNFRVHKLAINKDIYKDSISITLYREIIFYACKVNEFEWALEFSEEYQDKLPEEIQETAYSFNKARIYINMKQYEDVIETLRDVEYKDITYNLNSKLMLMVSFYELDEFETLLATIRAFKVFLRRRRNVSLARKANFTGFCDALYNIMMADDKRDPKRIQKAEDIITANPAIPNTSWLKEKIEALNITR